ncbi:Cytochrome oxidase assembly protein ShyY1 [Pseudonocardia thermophila]|uniref:SURF1-like protein n=1 Tax=Pseudonocardia thermophila TaxID=1848 RepID=A0A1M6W0W2_PSETH|nr:SURF1 family cytochrome oxidase biogenesis protein [Pseudonocardia thermophila]SHK87337.1 Cytochrome oxidase assembly protein ShyY1 [Pseudonocardia thermophila]
MRFLLRPGWLALCVAVVGFAVACYTFLAPWQFGREAERAAQQEAIDAANAAPPAPLAELSAPGTGVTAANEWRRVQLTGTYLAQAQTLVRLRSLEGGPAYEVLIPMRTDDGRTVLVDRGLVAANGTAVPEIAAPPEGPVTVVARMRLDETDPQNRGGAEVAGTRQVFAADSRVVAALTGLPLEPGYLALEAGQPGVLSPVPAEPTVAGSAPFTNFSYALQWLSFGAIAIFALIWFVRLELMQREGRTRRRSELRAALAGEDEPRSDVNERP